VFYDRLVSMEHEGYLFCGLVDALAPSSKPVTLTFSREVSD